MEASSHPLRRYTEATLQTIERLGDPDRLVATLHIYEGLSIKEAAQRLELDYREASGAWRRAAAALRTDPGPYQPDDPLRLDRWSAEAVKTACGRAWGQFDAELADRYRDYFARHPDLKDP